jgi:hypothetical protein
MNAQPLYQVRGALPLAGAADNRAESALKQKTHLPDLFWRWVEALTNWS